MSALIGNYNHYLNQLRNVTGLNEARDGSTPDPNALVGVQKLAAANSNTATRHILDGSLYIVKRMAEATCLRVSDILEYAEFKEEFANQIGKYNVKKLNAIKDLYLYDFGIFVEVAPDEEEKAQLEQNIQVALSTGGIDLDDAIDIREIKNVKLANQLLKVKRSKKAEKDRMYSMQQQQQQAANQMKSQEVAAQLSIQKTQVESQTKMQEQQA